MKRIFWAGDSTVKDNYIDTYPRTGLAQGLRLYLNTNVEILNHAENARSTKNFISEGRLDKIQSEISLGDFLFIEFGHNDWNEDPNRHTEAFKDYKANLKQMVLIARNKGAYPVLITPLYCRFFDDNGKLKDKVHYNYPDAMIELAKELEVPCIDLCERSKQLLLNTELSESKNWYMNLDAGKFIEYPDGITDDAHLQYQGAVVFAKLISDSLKELGTIYAELTR